MVKLKTLVALESRWMGALLICCSMGIAAQSVASDYDVEVLVFENIGPPGTEHHPEDPGRPDIGSAARFPSTGLTLGDLARRLQSSPNHRLLAHQSWRQPGLGPSSAKPVALVQTLEGSGTLFGTITLIRRRYLHADVDLWFETGDTLEQARMQQTRRMRSDELHYLDHPRMGVIIIARPVG